MGQSLLLSAGIAANSTFQARVYNAMNYSAWYKMNQPNPPASDIALSKTIFDQTADMYGWATAVLVQTVIAQGTYSATDGSDIPDDVIKTQVGNVWAAFALTGA